MPRGHRVRPLHDSLYPRDRVEAILQPFTAQWTVSRIMLKALMIEPLDPPGAISLLRWPHVYRLLHGSKVFTLLRNENVAPG
jgi:hypothetical protein